MIVLLSPAKTLDTNPIDYSTFSQPSFLSESQTLINILKTKSATDIQQLMKVSAKIADLNVVRFRSFATPFAPSNAKQAIFAFRGDVYTGFDVDSMDSSDLDFAQNHVRILSGLYGILRPYDLMQPYRLEMGTKLANQAGKNLYEFWDTKITKQINQELATSDSKLIVNLASKEYFKSVQPKQLDGKLLHINFKENKNGQYKIVAFFAKKARGMMTNYIVKNKITDKEALKGFTMGDYAFNADLSEEGDWVFTR